MTATKNFHVLLWITGAYLFTSSSLGLAHGVGGPELLVVPMNQAASEAHGLAQVILAGLLQRVKSGP